MAKITNCRKVNTFRTVTGGLDLVYKVYIAAKNPDGSYYIDDIAENWHDAVDSFEPIDCIDGEMIIYDERGNKFLVGPHKDLRKSKTVAGMSIVEVGAWEFDKGEPFLIDTYEQNLDELNKLRGAMHKELIAKEAHRDGMDEIRRHDLALAKKYVKRLSSLPGVTSMHSKDDESDVWTFTSKVTGSHSVNISLLDSKKASILWVGIEGADTGYWNTVEEAQDNYEDTNLDFYVDLAESSLAGEAGLNTSPIFRFKEICFKHGKGYYCTRVEGEYRFGYTQFRKQLRSRDR